MVVPFDSRLLRCRIQRRGQLHRVLRWLDFLAASLEFVHRGRNAAEFDFVSATGIHFKRGGRQARPVVIGHCVIFPGLNRDLADEGSTARCVSTEIRRIFVDDN
jgi:hypothetical protein